MNKKICGKCKNEYDATTEFFSRDGRNIDGLQKTCKNCFGDQYQLNKKRVLKHKADQRLKNPENYRERDKNQYLKHNENIRKKTNIQRRLPANFAIFKDRLSKYNDIISDENGNLQVRCTYCNRYYTPTTQDCHNNIRSINKLNYGEGKFYCSDNCKAVCPIYKVRNWPKGFKKGTSREVDPLIRKMALKRDNYQCQNKECNKTIDEISLHCHHIEGVAEQPILSNDLDNVIIYCINCHFEVHSKEGCTRQDYKCKK